MWKPISELPATYGLTNKMFVVKAIKVSIGDGVVYTSDPYCVWITLGGKMPRWPHEFEPTHFCELPDA